MAEIGQGTWESTRNNSTWQLYELQIVTGMQGPDLIRGTGVGYKREDRYGDITDGHLKGSNPLIPAMQFQRPIHPSME
jgi:hypothetical protein